MNSISATPRVPEASGSVIVLSVVVAAVAIVVVFELYVGDEPLPNINVLACTLARPPAEQLPIMNFVILGAVVELVSLPPDGV